MGVFRLFALNFMDKLRFNVAFLVFVLYLSQLFFVYSVFNSGLLKYFFFHLYILLRVISYKYLAILVTSLGYLVYDFISIYL